MINSSENKYLEDEEVEILDYIDCFTYEKYENLMNSSESCEVNVAIPKFSYEYMTSMKDILKNMGIEKGFDTDNATNLPIFMGVVMDI